MTLICDPTSPADECLRFPRSVSDADGVITALGPIVIDGDALPGSVVHANGAIQLQGAARAATLISATSITIAGACAIGGRIVAGRLLQCVAIDSKADSPTEISVGSDETILEPCEKRLVDIKATRNKAIAFRAGLQPMLKGIKELSAEQKEKVTELLFQVQSAEKRVVAAAEEMRKRLLAATNFEDAKICVSGRLYAGVKLIFPGMIAEVTSTLQGPLEIACEGIGPTRSVVIRHMRNGSMMKLKSAEQYSRIQSLLNALEGL